MRFLRRRTAFALAGITTAAAFAAPMAAQADAAPVKFKVAGSSKFLTYTPFVGFATMKTRSFTLPDEQRWEQIDAAGSGPAVVLRNVGNLQCLRANPLSNALVRTRSCDTANKEQQWVLSSTGQFANVDRLARNVAANSLTVDFQNVNFAVGLAAFKGTSNQVWSTALF
jgi:hypothetical protein